MFSKKNKYDFGLRKKIKFHSQNTQASGASIIEKPESDTEARLREKNFYKCSNLSLPLTHTRQLQKNLTVLALNSSSPRFISQLSLSFIWFSTFSLYPTTDFPFYSSQFYPNPFFFASHSLIRFGFWDHVCGDRFRAMFRLRLWSVNFFRRLEEWKRFCLARWIQNEHSKASDSARPSGGSEEEDPVFGYLRCWIIVSDVM